MTEQQIITLVFDAIADTLEQSANLQARAELIQQIADRIQAEEFRQTLFHGLGPNKGIWL